MRMARCGGEEEKISWLSKSKKRLPQGNARRYFRRRRGQFVLPRCRHLVSERQKKTHDSCPLGLGLESGRSG
jgi:hypothetical protein